MVLDQIIARTREDVARRIQQTPFEELRRQARPSPRSFAAALRRPSAGFVMECKRASPSEGIIREDYDPGAIASAYAPHADAISVLTDGPFFGGSRQHLREVREAVSLPLLCKDFVIHPYQVFEARIHGADAVLLMLSALDEASYRDCATAAKAAGIEIITEVHTAAELDVALRLGAEVIGINNRNLATLSVDLDTVRALAPRVPADRILICESGIRSHREVHELRRLVNGFLVGTSLMRAPDVPRAVRSLIYGPVKVCGLTRPPDAVAAWEAGASFGGLIFAGESPRRVDQGAARAIRDSAPLTWVGVFVNERIRRIAELAHQLALGAVQLHGEETAGEVDALRPLLPAGCEVWKAVRVSDRLPAVAETGADRLLLDTWRDGQRGDTGERFDWSPIAAHPDKARFILSGGLTPETAAAADGLGVAALDVSSGVEERPGIKSRSRLAAFFAALRGTGREADDR